MPFLLVDVGAVRPRRYYVPAVRKLDVNALADAALREEGARCVEVLNDDLQPTYLVRQPSS